MAAPTGHAEAAESQSARVAAHPRASQLIASGLDVLTISRRLGHGSPSITLDAYSHLFNPTDGAAAAVFDPRSAKPFSVRTKEPMGSKSETRLAANWQQRFCRCIRQTP
jgi:hypothetical protein